MGLEDRFEEKEEANIIESRRRFIEQLEGYDYDISKINQCFEEDISKSLAFLLWATKIGKIDVNNENWKKVWRSVFDYIQTNGLERVNLFEVTDTPEQLFSRIKERFYEVSVSSDRQFGLGCWADFFGLTCKALTFGIAFAFPIIEHIRTKAYDNFIIRNLYPENYHTKGFGILQFLDLAGPKFEYKGSPEERKFYRNDSEATRLKKPGLDF